MMICYRCGEFGLTATGCVCLDCVEKLEKQLAEYEAVARDCALVCAQDKAIGKALIHTALMEVYNRQKAVNDG